MTRVLLAGLLVTTSLRGLAEAPRPVDFSAEIRPLLSARCFTCHGPDDESRKAALRLDTFEEATRPGKGARRAVVPGRPEESEMIRRVTAHDPGDVMPPPEARNPVKPAEVELLRRWISQGARYTPHWAWQKPVRRALPPVRQSRWVRTGIDAFVLQKLEAAGFQPQPLADRATLARRLALDLTGLPADPADAERFLADRRRTTRVLHKVNFLAPGDAVEPVVPAAFHAWPESAPRNRVGLAAWLTHPDNPLTARVAVNRFWAQLMGQGLVETVEDFGTQGTLLTHRELLDWLAIRFATPAREARPGAPALGWDMKALLKLMVTSSTYLQASTISPRAREVDPLNRLYSRAGRRRLEADAVRDQALALSGLLSRRVGGPSVYPWQPEGLWRAAFNGERTWATSEGEQRYRRGLYTFLRRTVPYPSLATFDAPSREQCTLRRQPTNTPLQAFVTMNDPVFLEAAQALGRRLLVEGGGTVAERIRFGLRLVTGRSPSPDQVETLGHLYEAELQAYRSRGAEALRLATDPLGPLPAGVSPAEGAAWTTIGNVLLNLDAVLTRG